jgi:fatty-acyl-CoA synthase
VIKTGGEWISSLEIEDIIGQHSSVSEVAVIGLPDEKWGERPMALVLPKADMIGKLNVEEIQDHVRDYAEKGLVSKWGVPDLVHFVDEIDKTSVGKIDKKVLRQKYLPGAMV